MSYDKNKVVLEPTGNVFVDQGQITLAYLLNKGLNSLLTIRDISELKEAEEIYGIKWLAKNIDNFTSFSMIFTTNHIRMQSGFKPNNEIIFLKFLEKLLKEITKEFDPNLEKNQICDVCGCKHQFNFNDEYNLILKDNNPKFNNNNVEPKFSCREFFPLAGTMGSESQSFSNMSISPNICPRCLFMVYYLPFSSQVIEGNLAIFQTSNYDMQYGLTSALVEDYKVIINDTPKNKKFKNIGKELKSKNQRIFEDFFAYFSRKLPESPTREDFLNNFPNHNIQVNLWKYSNSGQQPYLEVENIPNQTIFLLYLSYCLDLKNSLIKLFEEENKKIKYPLNQLYNSIRAKKLYRFEKLESKSFKIDYNLLFLDYYYILGRSKKEISTITKIVEFSRSKYLEVYSSNNSIDSHKLNNIINKTIRNLIKDGTLDFSDYSITFSFVKTENKDLTFKIIKQMLQLNITQKDFQVFDKKMQKILDGKALNEYLRKPILELSSNEKFILHIMSNLFNYLKKKISKEKFSSFIDKDLQRKKVIELKSWFLINFARISINISDSFDYLSYSYLFEIIESWSHFRNLMLIIFLYWNRNPDNSNQFIEFDYNIPSIFELKNRNPIIEQILMRYLEFRIETQGKGKIYIYNQFVNPLLRGNITVNILHNYFEKHSKEIEFDEILWDKMLFNPKTGLQDPSYFMNYCKLFTASIFNRISAQESDKITENNG